MRIRVSHLFAIVSRLDLPIHGSKGQVRANCSGSRASELYEPITFRRQINMGRQEMAENSPPPLLFCLSSLTVHTSRSIFLIFTNCLCIFERPSFDLLSIFHFRIQPCPLHLLCILSTARLWSVPSFPFPISISVS